MRRACRTSTAPAKGASDLLRLRPLPSETGDAAKPAARINSRGRLNAKFIEALADDFEIHGQEALERVRMSDPAKYCTLAADLVPKVQQVEIDANPFAKVESMEEMREFFVNAVIEEEWAGDVIARMGSPIIEAKAIEVPSQ
jgi:hypothetical protein